MLQRIVCLSFILLLISTVSRSQENTELASLYAELDSMFANESVPANLFELADSLLQLENVKVSALNVRLGYVSEVMSAGRTFGPQQYGFIPGLTFFHHSGLFASVTGYSSNDNDPSYYLTTLSGGYQRTFGKHLALQLQQDYFLYHDSLESHPFQYNSQLSLSYQHTYFDVITDYAFVYGNDQAHRVNGTVNARLKVKTNGVVEAITFLPGISAQFGNADVYFWRQPRTAVTDLYQIVTANDYPRLTRREYVRLAYMLENDRTLAAAYFLRQRGFTIPEMRALADQYYEGQVKTVDTFGFMNLALSCPVVFRMGKFTTIANYTYNLPQSLPGESYEYDPTGYLSISVSYLVTWRKPQSLSRHSVRE